MLPGVRASFCAVRASSKEVGSDVSSASLVVLDKVRSRRSGTRWIRHFWAGLHAPKLPTAL